MQSNDSPRIAEHAHDLPGHDTSAAVDNEDGMSRSRLTEAALKQLAEWNATERPYIHDAYVPQLVAAQATITPDAVALVAHNQVISYQELNRRANRVAHYLQGLGVRVDVLVGICVERSVELIVGLLGILKAGGAYVPLDPTLPPPERLAFMVKDAQLPVLLSQQHPAANFVSQDTQIVCLDGDAELLGQQSELEPVPSATGTDLAYVIYISGSTGQPKGVQITHDSLLNLIFWHQRAFAVTPLDRATQLASPAFDATGWELWPYLTCSASIYLPQEFLRGRLPDYMVPAIFVELDALPLTAHGKVNRAALPVPDTTNTLRDVISPEYLTPIEEKISEIVAGLLKLERVGLDENFFILGGHSLRYTSHRAGS